MEILPCIEKAKDWNAIFPQTTDQAKTGTKAARMTTDLITNYLVTLQSPSTSQNPNTQSQSSSQIPAALKAQQI